MDSISGSRSIPVTPQTDEAFDAFWEEEARNPHRNRIRIGRTYQASIPPKLKQGESDGRKLEDLETIYWHKQPVSKNEELNEYFSLAKLVSLFARYKMFEKSRSEREHSSKTSREHSDPSSAKREHSDSSSAKREHSDPTVANNGVGNKEEVMNGCVIEPSHQSLDQQLMDIYSFVSSHHPPGRNEGCSSTPTVSAGHREEKTPIVSAGHREEKTPTVSAGHREEKTPTVSAGHSAGQREEWTATVSASQREEWTVREARLFASALEVYGKNFGAIKKAIPWKPVRSLMEHYYSSEDGTSEDDDDYMNPETEFLSAKSKNQTFQTLTVATCLTPQVATLFNRLSNDFSLKRDFSTDGNGLVPGNGLIVPGNGLIVPGNGLIVPDNGLVPGQEVKALKAKPVMKNQVLDPVNGNSLLGSLKFFMDGQLVLKLNAKQQEVNKKCSWVESLDTPKIPKPVVKKKQLSRSFKTESIDSGSIPDSGRSSVRSDEGRSSVRSDEGRYSVRSDEGRSSVRSDETGETESSDDDSVGSADSRSLHSPSFVPRFRSGTKIKMESNCQLPPFPFIPSPSSSHPSTPGSRDGSGNESSKLSTSTPGSRDGSGNESSKLSTSTPGSRDGSGNESSKLGRSDNQKRGVSDSHLLHALLLPEAKKRLKMSPRSHQDLLTSSHGDKKNLRQNLLTRNPHQDLLSSSHGDKKNLHQDLLTSSHGDKKIPHQDLLSSSHRDSDEVRMKLIQDRLEFPSLYSPFRTSSHGQVANGENNAVVDLSCRPSPTTNSSSEAIDLSSDKSDQKGCNRSEDGHHEGSKDTNAPPNWLQSYLPFYEQYYRYCSQSDQTGSTSSPRPAQSVSPPIHSTSEEILVPSRPKSTSSTTLSPKEKRKSDWNKKSPRK